MTEIVSEVQRLLIALIRDDAELGAVLSDVSDNPPANLLRPYIQVGEVTAEGWSAQGITGRRMTQTFHIWTDHGGSKTARDLSEKLAALMEAGALDSTAICIAQRRFLDAVILREAERQEFHAVVRIQILAHA